VVVVALLGAAFFSFRPHVVNPEAQAALDEARVAVENNSKAGFDKAIAEYNRAILLDPKWAQPWAELAYAYATGSNFRFIKGSIALQQAREAALKAIALDSHLAKAHGVLGWTQSLDFDEWPKAEESFRKALQLDPADGQIRHWFGVYLRKRGRFREAEEEDKSALALTHKRDANIWCELDFLYWTSGQLSKFHDDITNQLTTYPNFALTQYLYARLLKLERKFDQADDALSFAEKLGANQVSVLVERASLEEYRNDLSKAHKYLAQLEEIAKTHEVDGVLLAGVYAGSGDFESAFRVLEDAYRRQDNTLLSLATSPVLQPLRADPRYRTLLQRLHFTDQIMQQMEFKSSSLSGESRHPN
jgi:Tfp pilus assembly protein PilF